MGVLASRAGRDVRVGAGIVPHSVHVRVWTRVEHPFVAANAGTHTRGESRAEAQKSVRVFTYFHFLISTTETGALRVPS